MSTPERKRLLRDPSASEALARYGERHHDAFAHAIGLARMGSSPDRWDTLCNLATTLSLPDLAGVEDALSAWPDASRGAPLAWVHPEPLPALRLARTLHLGLTYPWKAPGIGEPGARAIATCPHAAGLISLDLEGHGIGPEGTRALACSSHLRRLTSLNLRANAIGPEGAHALADSQHLHHLTTLNLADNALSAEGVEAIATSPHFAGLTHLDLYGNGMGAAGARALARSPHMASLVELELRGNSMSQALEDLVFSVHLKAELRATFVVSLTLHELKAIVKRRGWRGCSRLSREALTERILRDPQGVTR